MTANESANPAAERRKARRETLLRSASASASARISALTLRCTSFSGDGSNSPFESTCEGTGSDCAPAPFSDFACIPTVSFSDLIQIDTAFPPGIVSLLAGSFCPMFEA
jgi:hypothetical protein